MYKQTRTSAATVIDANGSQIFCGGDYGAAHVLVHELCSQNRIADAYTMLDEWLDGHDAST